MPSWAIELSVIVLLALLNGFFAAAEIAILTARRGRLEQWADEGDSASRVALILAKDADRFLPTVQVGITLVGTFASAFAGARLKEPLENFLKTVRVDTQVLCRTILRRLLNSRLTWAFATTCSCRL